jgi:hypothetical protein
MKGERQKIMLLRINDRIINTDNITKVIRTAPDSVTVYFNYIVGQNPGSEPFNGEEATDLWTMLDDLTSGSSTGSIE